LTSVKLCCVVAKPTAVKMTSPMTNKGIVRLFLIKILSFYLGTLKMLSRLRHYCVTIFTGLVSSILYLR
jgi:hypothetical protein